MAANNVTELRLTTRAERTTRTKVDTLSFTVAEARAWTLPPFQRDLVVNARVLEIAAQIKVDGGVVPGVLTLGVMNGKTYLVDGQHRREAFVQSGCETGFADVRYCDFESFGDMADEFVRLNSQIVRLKPDDMLRGLEASSELLRRIRKACPYVGYSSFRRGANSPILSMSQLLRTWYGSAAETPVPYATSISGAAGRAGPGAMVSALTSDDVDVLLRFLGLAWPAWGRDESSARMWASLNLGLCAWLYRRTVITAYSAQSVRLTDAQFKKCLAALSADADYNEFLRGRTLRDRDRAPAHARIRAIFVRRLTEDGFAKIRFPSPEWAKS